MQELGAALTWLILLCFLAGVLWLVWGVLAWLARCTCYTFTVTCLALEQAARRMIDR